MPLSHICYNKEGGEMKTPKIKTIQVLAKTARQNSNNTNDLGQKIKDLFIEECGKIQDKSALFTYVSTCIQTIGYRFLLGAITLNKFSQCQRKQLCKYYLANISTDKIYGDSGIVNAPIETKNLLYTIPSRRRICNICM